MGIRIEKNITEKDLKTYTKAYKRFYFKKNFYFFLLFFLISFIFIFINWDGHDGQSAEIVNGVPHSVTNYNCYIGFGFGVGLLFIVLYWIYSAYKSFSNFEKRKFTYPIPAHRLLVEVTDEKLFFENYQSLIHEKWEVYSLYIIVDNILYILRTGEIFNPVVIPIDSLSQSEKQELIRILSTHKLKKL